MNGTENHQEIIIIKRPQHGEDGHHGGAWKIAFADFMTAMMALFLVLWLINAANEETKKAVASYFNPVKLVDRNRSVRGLYDAQGMQEIDIVNPEGERTGAGDAPEQGGREGETSGSGAPGQSNGSGAQGDADSAFFANPYETLDAIAQAHAGGGEAQAASEDATSSWMAADDGEPTETFLDPFAPERWSDSARNEQVQPDVPLTGIGDMGELAGAEPTTEIRDALGEGEGLSASDGQAGAAGGPIQTDVQSAEAGEATARADAAEPGDAAGAAGADRDGQDMAEAAPTLEQTAQTLRDEMRQALVEAFGEDSPIPAQLTVEAGDGAVLISVTDNLQIDMFGVGSAVPSGDLVVALERIGAVIAGRPGGIRIEGHTDGRPFASGEYDNWRLSAARAQAAYYMLVRGGVEEARFRQVSGLADRDLAVPSDPFDARNRRIDILLEVERGQ
ncbi:MULTISPECIES: MotB family protein [unclassified Roseitalea]|uniref:MotB family protein n=1 Tax=unclassified Roseitalea TaxID=2639107 RepID=UPI00273DC38E|nr:MULTISPECIES: MotB family protein [unclassified Roseitalea]